MKLFLQRFILSVSLLFCLVAVVYVSVFRLFPYGFSSPHIFCSHPMHDFGVVNIGDDPMHLFFIENTGNKPLLLRDVQSSCTGCLEVLDFPKEPITPGSKGQVKIRLLSERLLGQTTKQVLIFSNDPRQSIMPLEITAVVQQNSKKQNVKPDIVVNDTKKPPKVKISVLQFNESSKNHPPSKVSPSVSLSNE